MSHPDFLGQEPENSFHPSPDQHAQPAECRAYNSRYTLDSSANRSHLGRLQAHWNAFLLVYSASVHVYAYGVMAKGGKLGLEEIQGKCDRNRLWRTAGSNTSKESVRKEARSESRNSPRQVSSLVRELALLSLLSSGPLFMPYLKKVEIGFRCSTIRLNRI